MNEMMSRSVAQMDGVRPSSRSAVNVESTVRRRHQRPEKHKPVTGLLSCSQATTTLNIVPLGHPLL